MKAVAQAGFDPVYGARPLKRAIQQQIENPLAKEILSGNYGPGDTVHVKEKGGQIVFIDRFGNALTNLTLTTLHKLREHLQKDPKGAELLARLESEIPIKENPPVISVP